MNLAPDLSIFLQILIFLAVWRGLTQLVFAPTVEVLAEREKRTVAAEELAGELVGAAAADRAAYESTLRGRRSQMATESAAARTVAQDESAKILDAARQAAAGELAVQRGEVRDQVTAARAKLAGEADEIASQMLSRIAGGAS